MADGAQATSKGLCKSLRNRAQSASSAAAAAPRLPLPAYLQRTISAVLPQISASELTEFAQTPCEYLTRAHIRGLQDRKLQYAYLLLARHVCTERLKGFGGGAGGKAGEKVVDDDDDHDNDEDDDDDDAELYGISPELVLERAGIYEALGYPDLALADAYVAYTLLLVAVEGQLDSDLVPVTLDGERLGDPGVDREDDEDDHQHHHHEAVNEDLGIDEHDSYNGSDADSWMNEELIKASTNHALSILCRSALILGCDSQAKIWFDKLVNRRLPWDDVVDSEDELSDELAQTRLARLSEHHDLFKEFWCISPVDMEELDKRVGRLTLSKLDRRHATLSLPLFGWSQRQIYPWNEQEPDRMGDEALREINDKLATAAPDLEARSSTLPALTPAVDTTNTNNHGVTHDEEWTQLGLYAKKDLRPGSTILEERSMLTAIRPHGEALCDACAADMESISATDRRYCEGCNIPFCSEECHSTATARYHMPNEQDEETEEGYPPAGSPFCPGTVGNDDLHNLGRAESSTTPEWDLYFLLLSRTLQIAETEQTHPLGLFEIKYLWGDFTSTPDVNDLDRRVGDENTLPFSVRHHVELPLQWFEILMHSRPECRPYSATWLEKYDWWIVQTLFAKFRGVADAQQSTWTGKPEVAAVHPLWCLANHSCNPNVTWKPSGVRNLTVVNEKVWSPAEALKEGDAAWGGLKQGEEIWNHYTDIHEKDYRERRGRLQAVLGGDCRCERCTAEAKEDSRGKI